MNRLIVIVFILGLAFLLSSCDKSKSHYEEAFKQNTIEGFDEFIQKYPNSKFVKFAQLKLDSLKYNLISKTDGIGLYEEFIQLNPTSVFIVNAKSRLDSLLYSKVKIKDDINTYEEFINKYPKSIFYEEAMKRIKYLKSLPPKYTEILKTYPDNAFNTTPLSDVKLNLYTVKGDLLVVGPDGLSMHSSWVKRYGSKITVINRVTMDGKTYEPGTKLTVDKNQNWIVVSSWN